MSKTLAVGTSVLYQPHDCHVHDRDAHGEHLFHFHHADDAPGRHRKGDRADLKRLGGFGRRRSDGALETGSGHAVRHGAPVRAWPAWVTAVYEDGSADLDISHPLGHLKPEHASPDGFVTLHYPRVRHDAGKGAHTFHLTSEGE